MRKHAASSLEQTCGMPRCHGRWSLLFLPHSQQRHEGVGVMLYFKGFPQSKGGNLQKNQKYNFYECSEGNRVMQKKKPDA